MNLKKVLPFLFAPIFAVLGYTISTGVSQHLKGETVYIPRISSCSNGRLAYFSNYYGIPTDEMSPLEYVQLDPNEGANCDEINSSDIAQMTIYNVNFSRYSIVKIAKYPTPLVCEVLQIEGDTVHLTSYHGHVVNGENDKWPNQYTLRHCHPPSENKRIDSISTLKIENGVLKNYYIGWQDGQ